MTDITMPQLGETVTEGTITKWYKQVGDQVAEDEILYEVSTDKVDTEVGSPASGYLAEIVVPEGETVDVGAKLAVITSDAPSGGGGGEAPAPAAEEQPAPQAQPEPEPEPQPEPAPAPAPQPAATAPAEQAPAPQQPSSPQPAPAGDGDGDSGGTSGGGRLLSPVVRRLIGEHDLDPASITGTGAGGRITREDVLKVIEGGAQQQARPQPAAPAAPAPAPAAQAPPAAAAPSRPAPAAITPKPGERDTAIPHSNIRRRTAQHMVGSLQTSAHAYASVEVDFEAVEQVRRAEKDAWREAEGFGLTYLPFISRAVVDAIAEYPEVNATFGENELVVHHYVNLGIAVDLDFKGLMVPVVHDADGKRLRAIAREIVDLANRARTKKLGPDDIAGGTFTITNPGPFGTTMTMPIINQPQVAIVSTDAIKRRPVVVTGPHGEESIAIHATGNLTLSWDHRAFDGAYAAAFLNRLRELLETKDWAAEL